MIFPAEKWNAEEVAALHIDSRRRNRSPRRGSSGSGGEKECEREKEEWTMKEPLFLFPPSVNMNFGVISMYVCSAQKLLFRVGLGRL